MTVHSRGRSRGNLFHLFQLFKNMAIDDIAFVFQERTLFKMLGKKFTYEEP